MILYKSGEILVIPAGYEYSFDTVNNRIYLATPIPTFIEADLGTDKDEKKRREFTSFILDLDGDRLYSEPNTRSEEESEDRK